MDFEFLRERDKEFWDEGIRLFEEGKYNLSAFNFEQAIQLFLKYLIGKKIGEWPKTHYFKELIVELFRIYENKKLMKFYEGNEVFFSDLEDAYFTSRYYPKTFSRNHVSSLVKISKEFLKLLEVITGEKF